MDTVSPKVPDLSVLRVFVLDYNGHDNLIMIELCMLKMLQKTQNTKYKIQKYMQNFNCFILKD